MFYDTSTWQVTHTLDVRCERQSRIVFAPDGATFWFASDARTAALRDTRTMAVLLPLPAGYLPLAVTSDGSRVAMSVDMQRIQLWDIPAVRHQFRVLGVDWQDPSVRETSVMPRPAAL